MLPHTLLPLLAIAAQSVVGAPITDTGLSSIEAREQKTIGHTEIVGFPETTPNTTEGELMLKYKPTLKVFKGCVPFPAVDANGQCSGGLEETGNSASGCSTSTGQVYARAADFKEYFAIMYSWYMPKDSPSHGLGHRHDWEQAIVWLSANAPNATFKALSVSAHGKMSTSKEPSMDGTSPRVGYTSTWPTNHQLTQTDAGGGTQPLIAWSSMPPAAQDALQTAHFGSAVVPFKDDTFTKNLEKGYASI